MNYTISKYPVGATWEYRNNGVLYWIELVRMNGKMEIWNFGRMDESDGSGYQSDWTTSYASAKRNHYINGRFKRVK
jgi:hypothetical protein